MTRYDSVMAFARETLNLNVSVPAAAAPLSARGSDRSFYRFTWENGKSVIIIDYDPARTENAYYADIAVYLKGMRISVPEMIGHDPSRHLMAMEDIGDHDLHGFAGHDWTTRRILCQKTLSVVRRLHGVSLKDFPSDRVRLMEGFDRDLYLFEHDYFLDHFVKDYCGITPDTRFEAKLRSELASLAEAIGACERCLIHRDLQSQNVMIRDGEPYLIDFQGMRFGSPFYDLGSLLCDPYVSISDEERQELLSFYYVLSSQELDWDAFQDSFWQASVQRLMQALGAYGFLGGTKGLSSFLDHIPAGLDNLSRAASHVPRLTALRDLITECHIARG